MKVPAWSVPLTLYIADDVFYLMSLQSPRLYDVTFQFICPLYTCLIRLAQNQLHFYYTVDSAEQAIC